MDIKPLSETLKKTFIYHTIEDDNGNPMCPKCHSVYITDEQDLIYNFCPNCGEKLIEEVE